MKYDFTVLRNNAHASIEMFPEKFTKISRKVNEKIESESFGHLEFNTNPTFNDAMVEALLHRKPKTRQFVIKDLASAGKTTQLMSMAKALVLRLKNDRGNGEIVDKVVHFCSMQNYSSNHAMIASDDDLWDMILECHQSPDWAKEGKVMSFDDFSDFHKKRNVTPILLIDTLDLLTYGMSREQASQIANHWASLVKRMHSEGFLVVWTSRPEEYEELVEFSGLNMTLDAIPLPSLDFSETKKRISTLQVITPQGQKELERIEKFHAFMTTMVITFPILSRLVDDNSRNRSPNFLEKMMKIHTKMKDSLSFDEAAHPVLWVRDVIGEELPVDVYYECLTNDLFDFVINTIGNSNITGESVSESWQEFIEIGFLEKSLNPHILHGARLKIPKDFSRSEKPELMEYLVEVAERRGLVNIQPKFIEFTHQLYAEYCIFKQASNMKLLDEVQTFPSVRLRSIGSLEGAIVNDDNQYADLFKRWYLPFFLFNSALINKSKSPIIGGGDWAWVYEQLETVYGKEKNKNNEHEFLNPEKRSLAEKIENGALKDKMIAINGPPGTGKSSFASKWFHLKGDEFEQVGSKPNGTFISLSENLTRDYKNKFNEYFKGISPPIELNSISVDDLLRRLSNILNHESKTQMEFNETILSERYFIDEVRKKAHRDTGNFGKMVRKNGYHSLWNEFLTQLHDASQGHRKRDKDTFTEDVTDDYTSIFYDMNYKTHNKAEEDAQTFFDKMKEIFPNEKNDPKTRGEHAGGLINDLMERFYSGSENDEIVEQILPLRSDVLVIDEVQDLGTQVIKLCLLLHRGGIGQVIVLGDDEQTLDLEPFDWGSRFKEVGEGIYQAYQDYIIASDDHREDYFNLKRWKQEHVGKVAEGREQLKDVERNLPSIVDFIKESYLTSVFKDTQSSRQQSGAAVIQPGPVSKERLRRILAKEQKSFHGVYHFENAPLSIDNFIELAKAVYNSDGVLSIIAPSESIHEKLAEILADEKIDISLWHPNSIKGLEYERVLAISPWSIETSLFKDLNEDTWETALARYYKQGLNNPTPWRHKFEKIAKQRRRHANVMISRPKNVLVLLDLDMSSGHENYKTKGYELTNTNPPNIKKWLKDAAGDVALGVNNRIPITSMSSLINMVKSEEGAAQNYVSVLADMIASEKDLRNIQLQASHIVNLMKRKDEYQSNIPFLLIGSFMKKRIEKWSVLEVLLFNHEFRSRKIDNPEDDQLKQWKESLRSIQNKFHIIASDVDYDASKDNVAIPVNIYNRFEELQEELRSCVQDTKDQEISLIEKRLISEYIEREFFPEALESDAGKWIRIANMLNLKTGTLVADNNQPAYVLGLFKENFYSDYSEPDFLEVAKRRLKEPKSIKELNNNHKINKLIPYEAVSSILEERYKSMGRDEVFSVAIERGWGDAENISATLQMALEFLLRDDKEKAHMEVLEGDWWTKGADMLRANTIKPSEARSVLQRMKKQLKDPSTKVTTPEQLECIYELIIKTAKIPRRPAALPMLLDLEMLANNSPDVKGSISLEGSSFGKKWVGIIAGDILRHRMELNHLLSSDKFNIHKYFAHDFIREQGAGQHKSAIELDTTGNLSFVVTKCKSFIEPARYDKLSSHSKKSIFNAVLEGGADDWKYFHEKSVEVFLKQNYEALKKDKKITIDDIMHDDIIGLLPGEFGAQMFEEQFEDVSLEMEHDTRDEFVTTAVAQSLLRNYLLFKTGMEQLRESKLQRANKNFASAINNSLFGFEKRFSGKVNFQRVKELIFESGGHPEISDSDPILDIKEQIDNSDFVEWMGRLAKENPSFDAIGSLRLKAMEDLRSWLNESKKKKSPHKELRSRGLEWMAEANTKQTINADTNALLDYYVRAHLRLYSKSFRYTKFKEEFADVIRQGKSSTTTEYLQNQPIKDYHYRFGNKEDSIRIPLNSYMAIEILADALEVETLKFILAVINQYWLNTTTKTFHMSTLVRYATSDLGCNVKYVEMVDSEKLICSRAVSSLIDIVRNISGVHQSAEARDRIYWTLYRCNTYNEQDQNEQKKLFSLVEFLDQNVNKTLS